METLHLKLSKEDKQTIKDLAKSKRMSMTGYIRNEILNKEWGLPNKYYYDLFSFNHYYILVVRNIYNTSIFTNR